MPDGVVYVVKQVTLYASPVLAQTSVFLEDETSGAALFSGRFVIDEAGWVGFYGALVFEPGQGFHFQVDSAVGEGADCYAGGYVLTLGP